MKQLIKKTGSALKDGLVAMAILVVLFFGASRILPNFSYGLYIIQTGSMQPTIKIGSVVVDKRLNEYEKGDIITYKQTKKIITHRIDKVIEKEGEVFYETKGDANNGSDMTLTKKDDVFGKVLFAIPYLGYVMDFARTKLGIFFLIIVPSIWLISLEAMSIKKELAKKKKKSNNKKEDNEEDKKEEKNDENTK